MTSIDELNVKSSVIADALSQGDKLYRFTGWKASDINPNEFVAQWLDYHGDGDFYYYVNLPGMQHGRFTRGDLFDIGVQRVSLNMTWEHVHDLIEAGFSVLMRETTK